jgi:hypothetical protein
MKSEHRHQLETNILADWLGKQLEGLEQHKTTIVAAFAILVALGLVVVFATSGEDPVASQQWSFYHAAFANPDPTTFLAGILDKNTSSNSATLWTKKTLADRYLGRGTQMLFLNKTEAVEKLEEAQKLYTDVERSAGSNLELLHEARFGLARVMESLDRGDEAKKIYVNLAKLGPETSLGKAAADAIKRLENPRNIETLAWFAQQKPNLPKGHPPLGGEGMNLNLPDRPDFTFPGQSTTKTPSSLDSNPDDAPAEGSKEKTPAGDTPETPAKDADDKATPPADKSSQPAPADPSK